MSNNVERFTKRMVKADDESWARYERILDRAVSTTAQPTAIQEIERLHGSRSSRRLTIKNSVGASDLIKANLEDISYRSRLVEILVTTGKDHRKLEAALNAMNGHIMSNYLDDLVEFAGKVKTDRQTFVDSVLRAGWDVMSKLDKITEIAQLVIEDIDKTQWSMKNLVTLMELASKREETLKYTQV